MIIKSINRTLQTLAFSLTFTTQCPKLIRKLQFSYFKPKMKSILTLSIFLFCFFHVTKACNETITWSRENELNFIPNVPSAKECFEICFSTNNCTAYTWYGSLNKLQDVCILFEAQENQYNCENCLSGLVENGISCYCSQEGECLFDENNYLGDMFANSELDCFLECLNLPGDFSC